MSASIYPNEELLELRLQFWRKEIVRCLDSPTIVSQLAVKDVFDEDEKARLQEIFRSKTSTEAGEAVLDSFLKSSAPNKWVSLLNAFEEEGLVYVKSLLEDDLVDSAEDRVRGRKLIQLFGPELEKTINPIDILSSLVSKKAITEDDRDEVMNLYINKNRLHGVMCLLHRMQSQLRPKEWYYAFLCALWEHDYNSECERLEPDFLENSHLFDPKYVCEKSTDWIKEPNIAMSASIYPNKKQLESRLQYWRNEIVRCLDKPTIASQLAARDVFNEDEKARLQEIYRIKTSTEADEAVLDSFLKSSAPNKWVSLLNALEEKGLVYVKSLLEDANVDSAEDRTRGRKLIQLFGPELEKTINPIDILSSLVSKKAITEDDRDEVMNLCINKNRLHGVMCLLHRMQSQLRPKEWYYAFLCALWEHDYNSECERLEPDFLENSHLFDPKYVCKNLN